MAGHWRLRSRISTPLVTGANNRIQNGAFGFGNPREISVVPAGVGMAELYRHHEGDIFTPGGEAYAFEWPWEFPIKSIWGGGGTAQGYLTQKGLYAGAMFQVMQPPQVYSWPTTKTVGLGGLQAGQIVGQSLNEDFSGGNG